MFQRMIDDFKDSTGTALRLTSLAAAVALALFITTSFLCAAAFVFVLQRYGLVEACLTGAGVFFVVTLIAAGCYMVRKNQVKARAGDREISRANRACRSHAGCGGHPGDPRDRRQEADPDSGRGRIGVGIAGKPQQRRAIKRRRNDFHNCRRAFPLIFGLKSLR